MVGAQELFGGCGIRKQNGFRSDATGKNCGVPSRNVLAKYKIASLGLDAPFQPHGLLVCASGSISSSLEEYDSW